MIVEEEWSDVPGYAGRYEVSTLGQVRSWINNRGHLRDEPKVLALATNHSGYQVVSLSDGMGQRRQYRVARLVLEGFRGPASPEETASHLNGTASDDRLDNLVWESFTVNVRRKRGHGTARNQWGLAGKACPRGHRDRGPYGHCRVCDRESKRILRAPAA